MNKNVTSHAGCSMKATMLAALESEMQGLDVVWSTPSAGTDIWLRLPAGLTARELLPTAIEKGRAIAADSISHAYQTDPCMLRLSFSATDESEIAAGIAALAMAIREYRPYLFPFFL